MSAALPVRPQPIDETTGAPSPQAMSEAPTAPVSKARPRDIILDVRNLRTYFFTYDGVVKALDGVTLGIRQGETLGLVGETGCGKSVTAFSITRLIPDPPGRIMDGTILFNGANLLWGIESEARYRPIKKTNRVKVTRRFRRIRANLDRMTAVRGGGISMIFQEPTSALNPIFSISNQLSEALLLHRGAEIFRGMLDADVEGLDAEAVLREVGRLRARKDIAYTRLAVELLERALTRSLQVARESDRASLAAAHDALLQALATTAGVVELSPPQDLAGANGVLARALVQAVPAYRAHPYAAESKRRRKQTIEGAIQELVNVCRKNDPAALREAADALGRAAELPSIGTQAYYLFRNAWSNPEAKLPELRKAMNRLDLGGLQRSFVRRERRVIELDRALKTIYMREMRLGKLERGRRQVVRGRRLALRSRTFYFGLWGFRGLVRRALKEETFWESVRLLEGVSIANPVQVARGYPHELSGGMLQRVMIAMALSAQPELLIADEPTTALDVTIQAQILALMKELKEKIGTAILLITHDLGVIAEVADRVAVMYAGNVVEVGPVKDIYHRPLHPYTQGLLSSIPRLDEPDKKLESIPGTVPNLIYPPSGCRFHPRCPHAMPICKEVRPPMTVEGEGHIVACYLYNGPQWKG